MQRYFGGDLIKKGTYMNTGTGQFVSFGEEAAILPGPTSARYVRVLLALVLVVGPLMGLGYIIFLPLAGFGSLVGMTAYKLKGWTAALVGRHAHG